MSTVPKIGHKRTVQTQMDTAVHNISSHATLSHDVTSGSDIKPCNKINKPLLIYRFCNVTL